MPSPKYLRIAADIAQQIDTQILKAGQKLPTHRELAQRYTTTTVTISKAYKELIKQQRIESFIGRGSFVKQPTSITNVIMANQEHSEANLSILQPINLGQNSLLNHQLTLLGQSQSHGLFDTYVENSGHINHKLAGITWCQRYADIHIRPEQILLANGAQNALFSLLQQLVEPGDSVAVETFTYPGIISIAQQLGINLVGVGLDHAGICPKKLEYSIDKHNIKAIVVIPSHQNPCGITMPEQRRYEVAEVIKKHGVYLIEDDIYAFLNPERLPAISQLAPEYCFYISSLSKALSPGLRCAYIVAPEHWVEPLNIMTRASLWMPPPLMFELASRLIEQGQAFELAQYQKNSAYKRQQLATRCLTQFTLHREPNSFHVWAELPPHWNANQFYLAAKQANITVNASKHFCVSEDDYIDAIRISLVACDSDVKLERSLITLNNLALSETA